MTKREELIRKVRDGKVAILNTGTVYQLGEVLDWCFPNDRAMLAGTSKFYRAKNNSHELWTANNDNNIPIVSVKDFYEDEFLWGEEVEVSDDNESWAKRFYVAKNPKSNEYIATTDYGRIYAWVSVRKLPLKIELTHQMIADKFDIDVNNLEII